MKSAYRSKDLTVCAFCYILLTKLALIGPSVLYFLCIKEILGAFTDKGKPSEGWDAKPRAFCIAGGSRLPNWEVFLFVRMYISYKDKLLNQIWYCISDIAVVI